PLRSTKSHEVQSGSKTERLFWGAHVRFCRTQKWTSRASVDQVVLFCLASRVPALDPRITPRCRHSFFRGNPVRWAKPPARRADEPIIKPSQWIGDAAGARTPGHLREPPDRHER